MVGNVGPRLLPGSMGTGLFLLLWSPSHAQSTITYRLACISWNFYICGVRWHLTLFCLTSLMHTTLFTLIHVLCGSLVCSFSLPAQFYSEYGVFTHSIGFGYYGTWFFYSRPPSCSPLKVPSGLEMVLRTSKALCSSEMVKMLRF